MPFVAVKKLVESLKKLLLVCAERREEGGVVGHHFLFNKAGTNFLLMVVSRFVTLLLVASAKFPCVDVVLIHPRRLFIRREGGFLERYQVVKGISNSGVEVGEVVFEVRRRV